MNWLKEKYNLITAYFNSKDTFPHERPRSSDYAEDYSAFKVAELRAMAKDRGLKGYTGLRKADLVKMLQQN